MTGKQGPKSELGKAKSAANSTVHGLRSNNLATAEQKQVYDTFLKELNDYYQPESPLEKIQLERIAICKAKLQTLYALENAKFNVMLREYSSDPGGLLKQFNGLKPLVRGMLYELIRWKILLLPCDLTPQILESIHQEIQNFSGEISDEAHLKRTFPELVKYLLNFDSDNDNLDHRLMAISEKIIRSMERGENYSEFLLSYHALHNDETEVDSSDEDIEFAEQIRIFKEESPNRHTSRKLNINLNNESFKDAKHLQRVLKPFTELFIAYQHAINLADHINEFIDDKRDSLSLPQAEADLLLRYQTTWEKRLSSSIGEFLRLQEVSRSHKAKSIE
jgi:hypothetical protein